MFDALHNDELPAIPGKRYFTIGAHRWAHLTGVLLTAYFGVMMLTATSCALTTILDKPWARR